RHSPTSPASPLQPSATAKPSGVSAFRTPSCTGLSGARSGVVPGATEVEVRAPGARAVIALNAPAAGVRRPELRAHVVLNASRLLPAQISHVRSARTSERSGSHVRIRRRVVRNIVGDLAE